MVIPRFWFGGYIDDYLTDVDRYKSTPHPVTTAKKYLQLVVKPTTVYTEVQAWA